MNDTPDLFTPVREHPLVATLEINEEDKQYTITLIRSCYFETVGKVSRGFHVVGYDPARSATRILEILNLLGEQHEI